MPTINLGQLKQRDITYNKVAYQKVYQSKRWKRLRKCKVRENPVCEHCDKLGNTSITKEVHHIIPFDINDPLSVDVLAYDYDNLVSLCLKCHKNIHKSYREAV